MSPRPARVVRGSLTQKGVARAYGWPGDLSDEETLVRLVALNAERTAEEAAGRVRWLRPAYQARTAP